MDETALFYFYQFVYSIDFSTTTTAILLVFSLLVAFFILWKASKAVFDSFRGG
jgi:hypothetical protein